MNLKHTIITETETKQSQISISIDWDSHSIEDVNYIELTVFRKTKTGWALESQGIDILPMLDTLNLTDTVLDSVDWAEMAYNKRIELMENLQED